MKIFGGPGRADFSGDSMLFCRPDMSFFNLEDEISWGTPDCSPQSFPRYPSMIIRIRSLNKLIGGISSAAFKTYSSIFYSLQLQLVNNFVCLLVFPLGCCCYQGRNNARCYNTIWREVGCTEKGTLFPGNMTNGQLPLLDSLNLRYFVTLPPVSFTWPRQGLSARPTWHATTRPKYSLSLV